MFWTPKNKMVNNLFFYHYILISYYNLVGVLSKAHYRKLRHGRSRSREGWMPRWRLATWGIEPSRGVWGFQTHRARGVCADGSPLPGCCLGRRKVWSPPERTTQPWASASSTHLCIWVDQSARSPTSAEALHWLGWRSVKRKGGSVGHLLNFSEDTELDVWGRLFRISYGTSRRPW